MKTHFLSSLGCLWFSFFALPFWAQNITTQSPSPIALKTLPESEPPIEQVFQVEEAWQWRKNLMLGQRDSLANTSIAKFRSFFEPAAISTIEVYPVGQVFDYVGMQDQLIHIRKDTTFFCNLSQSKLVDQHVRFHFPSEGYWWQGNWSLQEVDFDDGQGWRTINADLIEVDYWDIYTDKHIVFKATFEGVHFYCTMILKGANCQSVFSSPDFPLWASENPEFPWRLSVNTEVGLLSANAYTLYSEDGVFDQPFIFVEGIDFGYEQYPYQNGTFGWCQFTGGDYSGDYSMMSESPVFLNELRERGYDIILLDFVDGAADIRANAEILIKLIQLCNNFKEGNDHLVVAGASMGGQVARCALSKMEQMGEPHCVGVYISLDSPHEGANIPLGLQALLSFMSTYNANADSFVHDALTRTAAQQLLIYQWLDSEGWISAPWKRAEYQNYLQSLPFPSHCFSMAIANGNFQQQGLDCSPFLIEENCDASVIIPGNELELRAFTLPGDLTNINNTESTNVIADLTFTQIDWNGIIPDVTQDHQLLYVPNNLLALDCRAGGYRASMVQLVNALNESPDFSNQCGSISSNQYLAQHCFVPSPSSWAIPLSVDNVAEAMEQSPFDFVYAPFASNESHSALTSSNAGWLLYHLDVIMNSTMELTSNATDIYNFGTMEDWIFPHIDMQDHDVISIQKQQGLHDGSLPFPAMGSHHVMKTKTGCMGAEIYLHGKARLEIGDEEGLSTASLIVRGGTVLRIEEKGTCWIFPGSELIIEDGGKVIIDAEGGLRNAGGKIVVKEGGELIYKKGYCSLEKESARLHLKGGLVHLMPGAQLNWTPILGQTGAMEVFPNDFSEFYLEQNATMRAAGNHTQDTLLILHNGAHCDQISYFESQVAMTNGKIVLEKEARMKWRADLVLKKLVMQGLPCNDPEGNFITEKNHVVAYYSDIKEIFWNSTSLSVELYNVSSTGSQDWNVSHGQWYWQSGQIQGHGIFFFDMLGEAVFGNVVMTGEGSAFGLQHHGSTALIFNEGQISDYYHGIIKGQGKLGLRCSALSQLTTAVQLHDQALLMINEGFGRNQWVENDIHLSFQQALSPMIQGGGNYFSESESNPSVEGAIQSTVGEMNWSGNEWENESFINECVMYNANNELVEMVITPMQGYQGCGNEEMYDFKNASVNPQGLSLFPNPARIGQDVRWNGGVPDKIIDASGRDVLSKVLMHGDGVFISMHSSQLSPGVYWVIQKEGVFPWVLLP
jgi:hypothetical protein